MARTSNTMLNRSGGSRHPCLVLDLSGKIFSFCPLSMMLAVGLSYMTFNMLRYVPSTHTLLNFFLSWMHSIPYEMLFFAFIDMIM